MSSCPNCGEAITEDFGVINCPKCQAALIINIDGSISATENQNAVPEQTSTSHLTSDESYQDSLEENVHAENKMNSSLSFRDIETANEDTQATAGHEGEVTMFPDNPESAENSQVVSEETAAYIPEDSYIGSSDSVVGYEESESPVEVAGGEEIVYEENIEAEDAVMEPEEPKVELNDLSDIESFANSDESSEKGSLLYNITLGGIDTSDIRKDVEEIFQDSKLLIDSKSVVASIKNGKLTVKHITPIKAHIIVTRAKNLPIQVTWEQYEIHS